MNIHTPFLILFCSALTSVPDRVVDGHTYAGSVTSGGTVFRLQGAGQYLHLGIWRVYSSALYLQDPSDSDNILGDVPKRLEMTYHRKISARDCIEIGEKYLKLNLTKGQIADIQGGIDQINALYRDLRPGDRYVLEYQPGRGTTLALNGKTLGTIPGTAFGSSYFAIWLGAKSPSNDLRKALLAKP